MWHGNITWNIVLKRVLKELHKKLKKWFYSKNTINQREIFRKMFCKWQEHGGQPNDKNYVPKFHTLLRKVLMALIKEVLCSTANFLFIYSKSNRAGKCRDKVWTASNWNFIIFIQKYLFATASIAFFNCDQLQQGHLLRTKHVCCGYCTVESAF